MVYQNAQPHANHIWIRTMSWWLIHGSNILL